MIEIASLRPRASLICLSISFGLLATPSTAVDIDAAEVVDGLGAGTIASPWAVAGNIFVGNQADGDLSVVNGAVVGATGSAFIGFSVGNSGALTVSGSGSELTLGNWLVGGWNGTGEINIFNGAVVSSTSGYVGYNGDATAFVTGEHTRWVVGGELTVGAGAIGDLSIADGGTIITSEAFVGYDAAATGSVTVTGDNSLWRIDNDFYVGLSGVGDLRIDAGGTVLSGYTVIGYDSGSSGSVALAGRGSTWRISGDLTIGYDGAAELTLSDAAELSVDNGSGIIFVGDGGMSQGTLNIGAPAGLAAQSPGAFDASELSFGAGTGRLVLNHTDIDYVLDSAISGSGAIDVYSGRTSLTGDLSGYLGAVTISGGALAFNTDFAAAINVLNGGTLGGVGTLSNVTLSAGATVSPGNSIGTLNVAGNLDFVAGSTYEVEVDNTGASDRIIVSGAVTIDHGSILSIMPENGSDTGQTYQPSTSYLILQATSLSGSFGTITDSFAYLDAGITYTATDATLTLVRDDSLLFTDRATSPNQSSVARAIESMGDGSIYDAILILPEGEPPSAFDALSGELYGSTVSALLRSGHEVSGALAQRIHSAFDRERNSRGSYVSGYAPFDAVLQPTAEARPEFWTAAIGNSGYVEADGNGHAAKSGGGGFLLGADYALGDGWRAGVAAGYTTGQVSQRELLSETETRDTHFAIYGGRNLGPLNLSFGVSRTLSNIKTDREVAFTGYTDSLTAGYDAQTTQAFMESGWRIASDLWQFEPYNLVTVAHVATDRVTESGGAAALTIESGTETQWTNTLGIRFSRDIAIDGMLGRLRGAFGWRHLFGDLTNSTRMRFSSGSAFTIDSAEEADDLALLALGIELELSERGALSLDYGASVSRQSNTHNLAARLSVNF